ncbi:MAG: hypothetical protein MUC29_09785 [Pyrinomonadaceae bacterium]|nr:hypothetical protein [Pyrinomonadaceae bacterium]
MKKLSFDPIKTFLILGMLAIPFGIMFYTLYWAWDSQFEADDYKIALEKDGKLYESNLNANSFAFDKGTNDDQLYVEGPFYVADIIALSYGNQRIDKTDNPFFAGKIYADKTENYVERETKYSTPKDSYQSYKFFDQKRNQIFAYELGFEDDYVVKIRPTFPMFSKRSYGVGSKQSYVKITKLLKDKLNKNLKIRTDEDKKLLILRFEN